MYICAVSVQLENILKLFRPYINDKIIFKEVGKAGMSQFELVWVGMSSYGLIGVCTT